MNNRWCTHWTGSPKHSYFLPITYRYPLISEQVYLIIFISPTECRKRMPRNTTRGCPCLEIKFASLRASNDSKSWYSPTAGAPWTIFTILLVHIIYHNHMTITVWKHDLGPSTYKDKEFREKYGCLSYMDGRERSNFVQTALRPLHRHSVCVRLFCTISSYRNFFKANSKTMTSSTDWDNCWKKQVNPET